MTHWANAYIGTPWEKGAQGPDAFDCWAFVRFISERHFDRHLPFIEVDADNLRVVINSFEKNEERGNWRRMTDEEPREDGDGVLMAHAKYPSHVGLWLNVDNGGVLHCVKGTGVVFNDAATLRRNGWGHVEYYRYIGE